MTRINQVPATSGPTTVSCTVRPVRPQGQGWWLQLTDETGAIYGYGQRIEGKGTVTGVYQGNYFLVQRFAKEKKELPIFQILIVVGIVMLIAGIYLIAAPQPVKTTANMTDIQKDEASAFQFLGIKTTGGQLCGQIKNVGSVDVIKEDLRKFRLLVNNQTYNIDQANYPELFKRGETLDVCVCNQQKVGCDTYYIYGGEAVEVVVKPLYGVIR